MSSERAKIEIKTPSTRRYIAQEKFKRWWSTQKKKEKIWWILAVFFGYAIGFYLFCWLFVLFIEKSFKSKVMHYLFFIMLWAFMLFAVGFMLVFFGAIIKGIWNRLTGKKRLDPDEELMKEIEKEEKALEKELKGL